MDQEIDFANIGVSIWLFSLEQNAISSHMSQEWVDFVGESTEQNASITGSNSSKIHLVIYNSYPKNEWSW